MSDQNPSPPSSDPSDPLNPWKVDNSGTGLTTNQGVPVADNQRSLKQGQRGPTLLEDFILREKITHFDHERIPERIVHARGSAAHGFFECTAPLPGYTSASFLAETGKRTDVFVRFSTVVGGSSSPDTPRDVRGFAIKFYTDQGVFDLVGNNIPVFFIQDAMKFPDLVHAVKPEPHHNMPQAASAHDTFWDFASLKTESTHMLMWAMSDRAIPRSYRMMQGFGVHTFRLINADGKAHFVKFHLRPLQGTYSLVWDEALKLNGADPDFHRRDLWEAIEAGNFPEWRLGLQIFSEEEAAKWPFDILDPTKLVPEELVPLTEVGRLVLNRNPDNFFAETEQVAFHPGHIVPGIDFSNDPLLQGRLFSYLDTQLIRLGGPNFHEIPINRARCPVHNNQRDGFMRQTIAKGRVSYEPNSLGGGCPMQMGARGFTSFPAPPEGDKVRADPERFADHFSQARLFWKSQTEIEKAHIVAAFQFELAKVETKAIRERVIAQLSQVDLELAGRVAEGLGLARPELGQNVAPPITVGAEPATSPALSLFARPSEIGIRGRKVAVLVAEGVDGEGLTAVMGELLRAGAQIRLVAPTLSPVHTAQGEGLAVNHTLRTSPSLFYDAIVLGGGQRALSALRQLPQALEFVRDAYHHGKTIAVFAGAEALLEAAGLPPATPGSPGLVGFSSPPTAAEASALVRAIERHRHYEREQQPPA